MKHVLAGLLLALTPAVAAGETTGQELIVSDLQDIGILIIGHTSGCGEANHEAIEAKVASLSSLYQALDKDGLSNEVMKVLLKSELVHGANVGDEVIKEKGCFIFNSYIVDHRFDMNTVDDIFSLYIPTSGV